MRETVVIRISEASGSLHCPVKSIAEVAGYSPREAVTYAPHTTVAGLLQKESGKTPFANPKALLESLSPLPPTPMQATLMRLLAPCARRIEGPLNAAALARMEDALRKLRRFP